MDSYRANARSVRPAAAYSAMAALRTATVPETAAGAVSNAASASSASGEAAARVGNAEETPVASEVSVTSDRTSPAKIKRGSSAKASPSPPRRTPRVSPRGGPRHAVSADASV